MSRRVTLTCEATRGAVGCTFAGLHQDSAQGGDTFRCLWSILALIPPGQGVGFQGQGEQDLQGLGAVPSGGRGTEEITPKILPMTWNLSHPPGLDYR